MIPEPPRPSVPETSFRLGSPARWAVVVAVFATALGPNPFLHARGRPFPQQETGVSQGSPLGNDDVVRLVEAGMDEELVSRIVRQAEHETFDVSPDAILSLQERGVPKAVLLAMLDRVDQRDERSPASSPTPASQPVARQAPQGGEERSSPKWKFWKRGDKDKSSEGGARRGGGDTFLSSDDYEDGDEVIGVFLGDREYALMAEDFEYGGVEVDYGWMRGDYGGRNGRKFLGPDFRARNYGTVQVVLVGNFSPGLEEGLEERVHAYFVRAAKRLGLEVVDADADLELAVAIVDYKSDRTYIYVGMVDPFIELEVRLRDLRSGEDLLLVRNQDHNTTPVEGAGDTAAAIAMLLQ